MRFIILSDSKGRDKGINEKVLTKLLRESKKLSPEPDFIVLGGDNVAGSHREDIFRLQLQTLRGIISKYYPGIALLPVIGNHEVNLDEPKDDCYEKIFQEVYSDMLPDTCLKDYNGTAYYTDYGDTRLIVLNSFHFGEFHKIGENQLKWLEEIASVNMKNKLLFVHSPAYPTGAHFGHCLDFYPDCRDAFFNVAERCNIKIIFSAHEHNYSRRRKGIEREVYQIITGGGGEKLKDKYKDREGVLVSPIAKFHFVAVDVNENHIKITAVSSEGKILDEFTL